MLVLAIAVAPFGKSLPGLPAVTAFSLLFIGGPSPLLPGLLYSEALACGAAFSSGVQAESGNEERNIVLDQLKNKQRRDTQERS